MGCVYVQVWIHMLLLHMNMHKLSYICINDSFVPTTVGRESEWEWHLFGAFSAECWKKEENKFYLTLSVRSKENKLFFRSAILTTVRKMWLVTREERSLSTLFPLIFLNGHSLNNFNFCHQKTVYIYFFCYVL